MKRTSKSLSGDAKPHALLPDSTASRTRTSYFRSMSRSLAHISSFMSIMRKRKDSNPRCVAARLISSQVVSTTHPRFHKIEWRDNSCGVSFRRVASRMGRPPSGPSEVSPHYGSHSKVKGRCDSRKRLLAMQPTPVICISIRRIPVSSQANSTNHGLSYEVTLYYGNRPKRISKQ